jgi:TRAP-type C4-dicarboxylate transport system permease small subunit
MGLFLAIANGLAWVNAAVLAIGRAVGAVCLGAMTAIILLQVFCRYVLGSALPWPEEASRFLMLWLTGLMAPTAFRRGGFVAVEMLVALLPRLLAALVALFTLALALMVAVVGFDIAWGQVFGFEGRFATDSLWLPTSLDLSTWFKVPRSWAMASLAVGCTLMIAVTVELMFRVVVRMAGAADRLMPIAGQQVAGAE